MRRETDPHDSQPIPTKTAGGHMSYISLGVTMSARIINARYQLQPKLQTVDTPPRLYSARKRALIVAAYLRPIQASVPFPKPHYREGATLSGTC